MRILSGIIFASIFIFALSAAAQPPLHDDAPLWAAVEKGDAEAVKQLLAQKTDVDPGKEKRWTPLVQAAKDGHTDIARLLIENGANVNFVGRMGYTPLIAAAENGHTDMARLLIDKGADVNFQDKEIIADPYDTNIHNTALIAAVERFQVDMVKLLLDKGAEINRQDINGKTTLTLAVQGGNAQIIDMLTQPTVADHDKPALPADIPVLYAYETGHPETVRLLIARGLPIDHYSNVNYSVLMAAAKAGDSDMVRLLLDKGAEVNIATRPPPDWVRDGGKVYSFGWTALMFAAAQDRADIARMLLARGADPGMKNSTGETALDLARQQNYTDMIPILSGKAP